jgi:Fungal Zn(2)-Cys(6) binuclear cluster domain
MDFDERESQNLVAAESLSCKICRRRKVRCDKKYPCSSCQKSKLECVFPQGRRRPTQGRSSRDSELIHRLKHLESAVHALKTSVVHKNNDENAKTSSPATSQKSPQEHDEVQPDSGSSEGNLAFDAVVDDFGRLNVRNGRSRYTSNALWASLSYDVTSTEIFIGFC